MNGNLLDTNVVSELRKKDRSDTRVRDWFDDVEPDQLFLSVLVMGELRQGVELIRRRDKARAQSLDRGLRQLVELYDDRIVEVEREIADTWGRLNAKRPFPVVDGLMASTAICHRLTLVMRNVRDVRDTGVDVLNPFE